MPSKLELFLLRDEEGPIVFAPLRKQAARINEAAVGAVGRRLYGKEAMDGDEAVIRPLEEIGFFEPAEVQFAGQGNPAHVTLFPTDGCNLRCRYCYAGAEKPRHVLPVSAGKAAVRYAADNAVKQGRDCFEIDFHGNGEPMTAFPVVKEVTEYAHQLADSIGLRVWISITTNGVMREDKLDWLMAYVDDVTLSFDGLEELQNFQRPMADGSASYPAADRTLRRLNDSGKPFAIRTTLTAAGIDKLIPLALHVANRYPACELLHIEPAWETGRSLQSGEHSPDAELFLRYFLQAEKLLTGRMRLVFSADRPWHIDNVACSAPRDNFTVTAEGLVTACYEVCETADPRADRFIYGRYDKEKDCFIIDEAKRAALSLLTVEHMPHCADCFCKYSCCGDCAAKLLGLKDPSAHAGSERCIITRGLTLAHIAKLLNEEAAQL